MALRYPDHMRDKRSGSWLWDGFDPSLRHGSDVETAKLAAVTAKRNVVPESGGTWLLPRLVGWAKAAELYYRARTIDAEESLKLGLVNEVVPADSLMDTAMTWAQEVADNAPMAVQTTKRIRMGLEESYDTAVDHLMVHLNGLFQSEDFAEVERFSREKETRLYWALINRD